ncbi:MAG: 4Fe-4S ferredoxin [Planctomycetota bacterium]|nr:4Fe-4S ferredoxin [Planctomycetota bacterium]
MAKPAKKRKRKPKKLAAINECCTGCAGSPVCQDLCPVNDCMIYIVNEAAPSFNRIWVDPLKCIGCNKCTSKGIDGMYNDGCPWNAIDMVELKDWEESRGPLPF